VKKHLYSIFLCFLFVNFANAKSFEILNPIDKSVYDDKFATLSLKINDFSLQRVTILLNNFRKFEVNLGKYRDVYCISLDLRLGKNIIEVTSYKDNKKIDDQNISLYLRSEIFEGYNEEPTGYKKQFFHTTKHEKLCSSCHNMEPDFKALKTKVLKASDIASRDLNILQNPEDSNCYTCHKKLTTRKNGHAPSVNFLCTECHTGKTGEFNIDLKGKSKYIQPDPIMSRCFSCHEGIEKRWMSNKSEHGPLRTGRCNKCHNPHSSANEFHLRKPIWKLCTTCHSEKAKGEHVIASFVKGKTHPTRGRPDPARPGRELVCSGCHNPHGSNGIFLLRTEGQTAYSVCTRCHQYNSSVKK